MNFTLHINNYLFSKEEIEKIINIAKDLCVFIEDMINTNLQREIRNLKEKNAHISIIRKNRDLFKLIVENQEEIILKLSGEYKIIYKSPSLLKQLSKSRQIHANFFDLINPEDADFAKEAFVNLLKTPYKSVCEVRLNTVDGWQWYNWSFKALTENDGSIMEIIATGRNIHNQKLTEDALEISVEKYKESENKFKLLTENLPLVIYLCKNDGKGTVIYLNDEIERLTGYPKEDFIQTRINYIDLCHPDEIENNIKIIDKALQNNESFRINYRIKRASGEWRYVEEVGIGVRQGEKVLYIEGFTEDISEKIRTRQKFEDGRNFFDMIVSNLPVGIYAKDIKNDSKVILWNKAVEEITGVKSHEIIGKKMADVFRKDAEFIYQIDRHLIKYKTKLEYEKEYVGKSGKKCCKIIRY